MHAQWAECSLEHLLTHTSGLAANFPWKAQKIDPPNNTDLVLARRELIQQTLDYAYGWVVSKSLVGQDPVIWHNGSNTLWYALLMLSPEKNTVLAFVTNVGRVQKAERAFIQAAKQIFDRLD